MKFTGAYKKKRVEKQRPHSCVDFNDVVFTYKDYVLQLGPTFIVLGESAGQLCRNIAMFHLYPHCQDSFIIADMSSSAGAVIRCTIKGTLCKGSSRRRKRRGGWWDYGTLLKRKVTED